MQTMIWKSHVKWVRGGGRQSALIALALAAQCLVPTTSSAAKEEKQQQPPKESFVLVAEKAGGQFTACVDSCRFRDLLFGSDESLDVAVRSTGPSEKAKPTSPRLVLQRQVNGSIDVLQGEAVTFEAAESAEEQDHFAIDLGELDGPSEYTGALLFGLSNGADPISIPVTLKIREGPLWPLIALIGAVILGAVIRWLLDLRGATRFHEEAQDLKKRIEALPAVERTILEPLWNQMWAGRDSDLTTAQTRLKALVAGADALQETRDAQDEALRSPQAMKLTAWVQRIGSATSQLVMAVGSFAPSYDEKVGAVTAAEREFAAAAAAKAELDELTARALPASGAGTPYTDFQNAAGQLEDAIAGVSPDASQAAPDLEPLLEKMRQTFAVLESAHGSPLEGISAGAVAAGRRGVVASLVSALGWPAAAAGAAVSGSLSGFDIRAVIGKWFGDLAAIGVMLVLLVIGFKVTYLDNATFGANLTDWLALGVWGLAAYGARQTLTGLGPTPSKED